MTFAFGHIIGAWLLGKMYEFLSRKKITHYTWFFLIIGGILPDADYLIDWVLGTDIHRTFTHSFLFLFSIPLLVYLFFTFIKNKERNYFAIALGGGILTHLFLDLFSTYGIPLLWPSQYYFSYQHLIYNPPVTSFLVGSIPTLQNTLKLTVIDMALGAFWIFYLWYHKKVQF